MLKYLKYCAIVVAILIAIATIVVVIYALQPTYGLVSLQNCSSSEIVSGDMSVCGEKYNISHLKPGETKLVKFNITTDSDYNVSVQFASGKSIHNSVGYVTHGLNSKDFLKISEKGVAINLK